jgi:hypothetical protein
MLQCPNSSVRLAVTGYTLAEGLCNKTFEIYGLNCIDPQLESIKLLHQFKVNADLLLSPLKQYYPKLLAYLVALDGHLEGKSYREIAQVLYGDDRVSAMWTGESRFMKDKVRRAVEGGIAFMEGE